MKQAASALLMVVIVVVLSGCGSTITSMSVPDTYTAPTIRTFPRARTGELIRCIYRGVSAGVHIPPAGKAVGADADGTAASVELEVTRANDGSLVVSCQL